MEATTGSPVLRQWSRRRRRQRRVLAATLLLCVMAWFVVGVSGIGDWGTFAASAVRSSAGPPGSLSPVQPHLQHERDQVHLMLGRGRLILHRMTTYSADFNDGASKALAWAVVGRQSNPLINLTGTPGQPVLDLPLWPFPAVLTPLYAALAWRRVRPGRCVGCGYDLSAGAARPDLAGRCPECGLAQPCVVCGVSLLDQSADAPCPVCGWDRGSPEAKRAS